MSVRFWNIVGLILLAAGLALVAFWGGLTLYRGAPPPLANWQLGVMGAGVVGAVLALLPDPTYRSPLRGLQRINPVRLAFGALIFLFGFVMLAAVTLFLFLPAANLDVALYLGAAVAAFLTMLIGGRYLFVEPDGAVHIPQGE